MSLGKIAEDSAAHYLIACGYSITHNNWRSGRSEIDLIATQGDQIVSVEVKAGTDSSDPYQHFSYQKQRQLSKAMNAYIEQANLWDSNFRADLITLRFSKTGKITALDHYENII